MPNVYGYTRVSTAEQVTGTSLEEQARKVTGIAQAAGLPTPTIFRDAGVSGATPLEERPEGARLLAALQPGDTVIVAKLDRAFRSAADALARAEWLDDMGVNLILSDMGTQPVTSSGMGKLFFTLLAAMAEFERHRIRERTADGRAAKRRGGGYLGGKAPFGYRIDGEGKTARLVEVPGEQAALETIRTCRAFGESLRATATCVKQQHGYKLSHTAIARIEREDPAEA